MEPTDNEQQLTDAVLGGGVGVQLAPVHAPLPVGAAAVLGQERAGAEREGIIVAADSRMPQH